MALLTAREAETIYLLGDSVLLRGAIPGTDWHMVEITVPPSSGVPLHSHGSAEIFRVLSGEVRFRDAEGECVAGVGDMYHVEPDAPHCYRNIRSAPAVMLAIMHVTVLNFFRAIGTTAPPTGPGQDEIETLMRIAAEHGIKYIGTA
jgi:quercetin dioxygenase-like cupin family protein